MDDARVVGMQAACQAVWDGLKNDDGQCGLCGNDSRLIDYYPEEHQEWCPARKCKEALMALESPSNERSPAATKKTCPENGHAHLVVRAGDNCLICDSHTGKPSSGVGEDAQATLTIPQATIDEGLALADGFVCDLLRNECGDEGWVETDRDPEGLNTHRHYAAARGLIEMHPDRAECFRFTDAGRKWL